MKSFCRRSLSIREKQLGADHPDVAISLHNLGTLYYQQGNYPEAKKLISRALKIWQKSLGDDHPNTQTAQGWLNTVQQAMSENK